MHFIPFPPEIADRSATEAKRQYEARKGKRPADHSTLGVACYRDEDGKLHMAHDPYDPKHPEGTTPGLGVVHAKLGHYANDTSGYTFTVSDFVPASKLLDRSATWANPCVAVRKDIVAGEPYSQGRMLAAPSEGALCDMIPDRRDLCIRPSVVAVGMEDGSAPQAAVFMNPGLRNTAIIGDPDRISEALVAKYDVEMPDSSAVAHRWDLNPKMSEPEARLAEVCERLKGRYSFTFDMAGPGELQVAETFDFEAPEL